MDCSKKERIRRGWWRGVSPRRKEEESQLLAGGEGGNDVLE